MHLAIGGGLSKNERVEKAINGREISQICIANNVELARVLRIFLKHFTYR